MQRVQGSWEDVDSQYYGEYEDAPDDEWYECDYRNDPYGYDWSGGYARRYTYNEWAEHGANSVLATGSIAVGPLAAA